MVAYSFNYHSKEILSCTGVGDKYFEYMFNKFPISFGSLCGEIYLNDSLIHTFEDNEQGVLKLSTTAKSSFEIISGKISINGILELESNCKLNGKLKIVASYETWRN